jgi:hypothetical protein
MGKSTRMLVTGELMEMCGKDISGFGLYYYGWKIYNDVKGSEILLSNKLYHFLLFYKLMVNI